MCSISAVIPFGQSEVHLGYDRSKLDQRPSASHRPTRRPDQGDVPVQPVEAHGAVHDGSRLTTRTRTTSARCRAAPVPTPTRAASRSGARIRHASLLLIARSPRASFEQIERPPSGGLFHCRLAFAPRVRARPLRRRLHLRRASPSDASAALCSDARRRARDHRVRQCLLSIRSALPCSLSFSAAWSRPSIVMLSGGLHRLHAVPVRRRSGHQHARPGRDAGAAPAAARRPRPRPALPRAVRALRRQRGHAASSASACARGARSRR